MYQIAICDDRREDRAQLSALTRQVLRDKHIEAELTLYATAAALLQDMQGGHAPYDLYLLDILMGDENGVDLARTLRQMRDPRRLVFVTSSRDYAVEKVWNPSGAATHEITLALYRTTDAEAVGSLDGEPVPADELDLSEGVLKVMLSGNSWTHTFQNLPRYNANSQLYYYYALELDSSGDPIPRNGKITQNGTDYEVSYDWGEDGSKTTVTNTTATGLTGIKTWVDNGNAYGTRPVAEKFRLNLWRKLTSAENWTPVDLEED